MAVAGCFFAGAAEEKVDRGRRLAAATSEWNSPEKVKERSGPLYRSPGGKTMTRKQAKK